MDVKLGNTALCCHVDNKTLIVVTFSTEATHKIKTKFSTLWECLVSLLRGN